MIYDNKMMNKIMNLKMIILVGSAALLGLSACSGAKESLGLTKTVPDEFKVVKRAPLAMPPEFTLRPPRAGAPRPQEQSMSEEARQVIFGGKAAEQTQSTSSAEELLLQELGSDRADPNIRDKIQAELAEHEEKREPIGTRLFGIGGNSDDDADTVDAKAESARLHGSAKSVEQSALVAAAEAAEAEAAKAAEKAKAAAAKAAKVKAAKVKAAKAAKKKAAKAAKVKAEAKAKALKEAEAKAEAEAVAKAEAEIKAAIEEKINAIADETVKQSESVSDDAMTIIQDVESKSSTVTGGE